LGGVKIVTNIKIGVSSGGQNRVAKRDCLPKSLAAGRLLDLPMIGRLTGQWPKNPQKSLDCHGVATEVLVPMSTNTTCRGWAKSPACTHFIVREDAQLLYGLAAP
jgi:hypothetical protein